VLYRKRFLLCKEQNQKKLVFKIKMSLDKEIDFCGQSINIEQDFSGELGGFLFLLCLVLLLCIDNLT
jgi:hypothetical protein